MLRIISRAEWGARPPSQPIDYTDWAHRIGVAFHYSDGSPTNTPRDLQNYAMSTLGYRDTHYNLFVDRYGDAYWGRDGWLAVAAHALNENTPWIGVCFIGRNTDVTPAALNTMRAIYNEACRLKGSALQAKGHKDLPGQSTDCPGDNIEEWLHAGMPTTGDPTMGRQFITTDLQRALKDAGYDLGPTGVDDDWSENGHCQRALTAAFKAAHDALALAQNLAAISTTLAAELEALKTTAAGDLTGKIINLDIPNFTTTIEFHGAKMDATVNAVNP